ncbi:hypothetical protein [Coleofasciculus sp. FACHB-1120]|nr:hypothetical protein [Coleofasciculus sp. FACHB-1120]MBD2741897.1 hypothetical protein [Coleofasciculus sp. FACHB-1120]
MRSLFQSRSANAAALRDRLHSILEIQIATLVNRVGAYPHSVQLCELGYR